MTDISDDYMREMHSHARGYTLVLLKSTPKRQEPGADAIIWEHGRRNYALRAEGTLAIVGPIRDGSALSGIGIFNAPPEEVTRIMEGDPAVQAGIFTFEVHPLTSFPGDSLPA